VGTVKTQVIETIRSEILSMENPKKQKGVLASTGPYQGTLIGYIYRITNTVNKMLYIGLTTRIPSKRWSDHVSTAKEAIKYRFNPKSGHNYTKLYEAMAEHTIEKFVFEVLVTVPVGILGDTETMFIKHYDCIYPKGYNLNSGGYKNHEVSDLTRGKLSFAVGIALAINPDKDRKHEQSKGLPTYLNYRVIGNQPCYVIEHHPKCSYKTFRIIDYESDAMARETAISFVKDLDKPECNYKSKTELKAKEGYPLGIRPARTHEGRALTVQRGYWDSRLQKTIYLRKTVFDELYSKEDAIEEAKKVLAEMDALIIRIQNGEDVGNHKYTPNRK